MAWIVIAVLVGVAGVIGAGLLDRKGYAVVGLLMAALTGLLVSPVSWDHHWVWIVPGAIVAAHYAVQAWRRGAWRTATACGLLAVAIVAWFRAWPTRWFGVHPPNLGEDSLGLPWIPKNTQPYLVPVVRRQVLVPRVPLARAEPHCWQRLHPGRAGRLRGAAGHVAAAARGQEGPRR